MEPATFYFTKSRIHIYDYNANMTGWIIHFHFSNAAKLNTHRATIHHLIVAPEMNETEKYNIKLLLSFHVRNLLPCCIHSYNVFMKDEKLRQPLLLFCCYRASWEGFTLNLNKLFHLLSFNLPACMHAMQLSVLINFVLFCSPPYQIRTSASQAIIHHHRESREPDRRSEKMVFLCLPAGNASLN